MYKKVSQVQNHASYLKGIHEAENALISNVRLLSLLTSSQNNYGKKGSASGENNSTKKKSAKASKNMHQVQGSA
jgi:hypothetical protein